MGAGGEIKKKSSKVEKEKRSEDKGSERKRE